MFLCDYLFVHSTKTSLVFFLLQFIQYQAVADLFLCSHFIRFLLGSSTWEWLPSVTPIHSRHAPALPAFPAT